MSTPLLNTEQQRAAHAPLGPTLVAAGPGSGKTRVATERIAWLIDSLSARPESILVFTFTNQAAASLRGRLAERLDPEAAAGIYAGTFHSWGARFLRQHPTLAGRQSNFTICDQQESDGLLREALTRIDDPEQHKSQAAHRLRQAVSKWKNDGQMPEMALQPWRTTLNRPTEQLPRRARHALAYQEYQRLLAANNALDFDDLIALPLRILQDQPSILTELQSRIRHVIVDEYQDTNANQHRLVTTIVNRAGEAAPSIFIVGDPDQAIYGFRHADIRNINNFRAADYPNARELHLENNYRSSPEITDASQALIAHNRERIQRTSHSVNGSAARLDWLEADHPGDEAERIAAAIRALIDHHHCRPEDFCICYRVNPQSRPIEEALSRQRLLYQVAGNYEFYRRAEVRRYLDYLRVIANPLDHTALQRIINVPARGIGPKTLAYLETYARNQDIHLRTAVSQLYQAPEGISPKAQTGLSELEALLQTLQRLTELEHPVSDLITALSQQGRLKDHFGRLKDGQQRLPNIAELEQLAAENPQLSLTDFLERSATHREAGWRSVGRITVSSIHQTKGLEFDRVYIAGVEEELLPHARSLENPAQCEEERRLLYVAITRARQHVTLSWCRRRPAGASPRSRRSRRSYRSRFVDEIPTHFWRHPLPPPD